VSAKTEAFLVLARRALPEQVGRLYERGLSPDDHVFAFFNATLPPGLAVATNQMQVLGFDAVSARAEVVRRGEAAQSIGQLFATGGMFSPDALIGVLMSSAADESVRRDLARLVQWLRKAGSPNTVRVVVVNGDHTLARREPLPIVPRPAPTKKGPMN
jgi:hypothetical protein